MSDVVPLSLKESIVLMGDDGGGLVEENKLYSKRLLFNSITEIAVRGNYDQCTCPFFLPPSFSGLGIPHLPGTAPSKGNMTLFSDKTFKLLSNPVDPSSPINRVVCFFLKRLLIK